MKYLSSFVDFEGHKLVAAYICESCSYCRTSCSVALGFAWGHQTDT